PVLSVLPDFFRKPAEVTGGQHAGATFRLALQRLQQALLTFAFLPYESFFSLDAIVRTLWRSLASHKHLLEWNPSSEAGRHTADALPGTVRRMWISPTVALAAAVFLAGTRPAVLAAVLPILFLWL